MVCQCGQPGSVVDLRQSLLARSRLCLRWKGYHFQDHYEGVLLRPFLYLHYVAVNELPLMS